MELDVGQGCIRVSDTQEIIGMAGVNYLPLKPAPDGTFEVLLCRLDGLTIHNCISHYQFDDCIGDHMRMVYSKTPFGELGGNARVNMLISQHGVAPIAAIKTVEIAKCLFTLQNVTIREGMVFGVVKPNTSLDTLRFIGTLRRPSGEHKPAAVIFTWRVLNKIARFDGINFEDVSELINYDVALLTEQEIQERRNRLNR